jgi:uncharacterized membrane protein
MKGKSFIIILVSVVFVVLGAVALVLSMLIKQNRIVFVEDPYVVYSDLRIVPLSSVYSDPAVKGVVSKKDLERILNCKADVSVPFGKYFTNERRK